MRRICALVLLLAFVPPARAQERPLEDHDLPRQVEARLRMLLDDSATVQFSGPTRIEAGRTVRANVTAFGGPFTLAGTVAGDLVIIDGDLVFEPGGEVEGDVTVVAGRTRGVGLASIAGTLTVYGEGFGAADRQRLAATEGDRGDGDWEWWWDEDDRRIGGRGYSRIVVRPGGAYNRIEGLPIRIGPLVQTDGPNPLRLTALAIVRTENGGELDRDDLGFSLRAEQFLGGRGEVSVGLGAQSIVQPLDAWALRDLEAALSTFLLHADPRDYYDRVGWTAFARYTPRGIPLDATLAFRSEEYGIAPVNDPYTLFGDDPWRLQPLVATGTLRSITGEIVMDARDDDEFPTRGWYIRATALRGIDGAIEVPGFAIDPIVTGDVVPVTRRFEAGDVTHLLFDGRRYERVGGDGLLAFRFVAGGTPTNQALPPQFQHALGGAGTVPGFDRLALDCGARLAQVTPATVPAAGAFYPFYGCDRFALFQAEYIGEIDIGLDFDGDDFDDADEWWEYAWDWDLDLTPAWAAFFDAAQGWTVRETEGAIEAVDTGMNYDIGAGLLLGDFGVYGALPLTGPDEDVRIILRLGRRF